MDVAGRDCLFSFQEFLEWLCLHCLEQLHTGAAFPSRTTALSVLKTFVTVYGATSLGEFCTGANLLLPTKQNHSREMINL